MRKPLLALFLALFLTLGLAACGSSPAPEADNTASDSAPSESIPQTESNGGVLVAYFSATGNTEGVAQQLAGLLCRSLHHHPGRALHRRRTWTIPTPTAAPKWKERPDARPALAGEALDLTGYHLPGLSHLEWAGPQAPLHLPGNL